MEDKEKRIRRADVYKQYQGDPVFREPWNAIRSEFSKAWQNSSPQDHATRERVYELLSLMDKFDKFVAGVILSGEVDKHALEAMIRQHNGPDTSAYQ